MHSTAHQHKDLIATVKHGGGGLMIWACFSATGPVDSFGYLVDNGVLRISKYSRIKSKSRLKLGGATGQ